MVRYRNIGRIIQKLVNDLFKNELTQSPFNEINWNEDYSTHKHQELKTKKFKNPEYHLFIFNVLLGRFEMSKIFWYEGKNQISNALIAYQMLKKMAKFFEEKSAELTEIAKY